MLTQSEPPRSIPKIQVRSHSCCLTYDGRPNKGYFPGQKHTSFEHFVVQKLEQHAPHSTANTRAPYAYNSIARKIYLRSCLTCVARQGLRDFRQLCSREATGSETKSSRTIECRNLILLIYSSSFVTQLCTK